MSVRAQQEVPRRVLLPGQTGYPPRLLDHVHSLLPPSLLVIGAVMPVHVRILGILSSAHCPGRVVLETYELMQKLKLQDVLVAGGFHAPMERECLRVLLSGRCGLLVCPARAIGRMRIPVPWRPAVQAGRLTILSAFGERARRASVALAVSRNELVAALSDLLLVPFASKGGKTECLAREVLARGDPVFTLSRDDESDLLRLGASAVSPMFRFG